MKRATQMMRVIFASLVILAALAWTAPAFVFVAKNCSAIHRPWYLLIR